MYWDFNGIQTASLSFPLVLTGETEDFSIILVTEVGESLANVFLFTSLVDYENVVSAKLGSDSEYKSVGYFMNSACGLGDIAANTETVLDFRILFFAGAPDGLKTIPIFVGYGEGFSAPSDGWDVADEWSMGDEWN